MNLTLDIQMASSVDDSPDEDSIKRWISAAIRGERETTELTLRIVDEAEGAELNQCYRGKPGPTNVLSFPFDAVTPEPLPILGDLVICAPVVLREAAEQQKTATAHWAHMVVHGVLHLLGHDHIDDDQADAMEALETEIMATLNFPPPYQTLFESDERPSTGH